MLTYTITHTHVCRHHTSVVCQVTHAANRGVSKSVLMFNVQFATIPTNQVFEELDTRRQHGNHQFQQSCSSGIKIYFFLSSKSSQLQNIQEYCIAVSGESNGILSCSTLSSHLKGGC